MKPTARQINLLSKLDCGPLFAKGMVSADRKAMDGLWWQHMVDHIGGSFYITDKGREVLTHEP